MKRMILISSLIMLAACSKLNLENYNKIQVGMKKADVIALIGEADKCEDKTLHTRCQWGDESKHIKISFVNDHVTLFSKQGLE